MELTQPALSYHRRASSQSLGGPNPSPACYDAFRRSHQSFITRKRSMTSASTADENVVRIASRGEHATPPSPPSAEAITPGTPV